LNNTTKSLLLCNNTSYKTPSILLLRTNQVKCEHNITIVKPTICEYKHGEENGANDGNLPHIKRTLS
jgi:hypothetical protein